MWNTGLDHDQRAVMADLFEISFVEIVQNLAEKRKFKKGEFARQAWPESTPQVARNRWNNMRTVDHRTGKPTSCTLSDAFRMAMALGFQIAYVTLQAEILAEQKFGQMTQAGGFRPQLSDAKPKRSRAASAEQ